MIPATFNNNSHTIDNFSSVLENMDVLRRLGGKQLESYTTALIATVAVGCSLLVLNIIIFAGIYHQKEKRAKDTKKKEKLEENEIFINTTPSKTLLNTTGIHTNSENIFFGGYIFDKKLSLIIKKDIEKDNMENITAREDNSITTSNTIDLLKIKRTNSNDSLSIISVTALNINDNASLKPDRDACIRSTAFSIPTDETSYQDSKSKDETDQNIPEPPLPKPTHLNNSGILRASGINQLNSASKKRVCIKEISV